MDIIIGKLYKHYKGGIYKVINVGVHTETGEALVVYSNIKSPHSIWLRPSKMWFDIIDKDKGIMRFTPL